MSLRIQSFVGIAATFIVLVIVAASISRFILLDNLKQIEERSAFRNIERAVNALSYTLSDIEMSASDWAQWDETYAFISDQNKDYIINNLANETLDGLRLNMMVFVDLTGHVVHGKGYDLDEDEEMPIPSALQDHLLAEKCPFVLNASSDKGVAGVIVMKGYPPLLVASQPIMTSAIEGPTKGSLLFGRFLGETEMARLSALTALNMSIVDFDSPSVPERVRSLVFPPKISTRNLVRESGGEHIIGFATFMDDGNLRGLMLRVVMDREVYLEGKRAAAYLIISIAGMGLVLGLVAVTAADRLGVSRLKRLSDEVDNVSLKGEITRKVSVMGKDEIASLAASINDMLEALRVSEYELRERAEQLQTAVTEAQAANKAKSDFLSSMSHELKTPLTAIIGITQLLQKKYYGPLNKEQEDYVRDVLESSNHLLALINDILDYARIEAGKAAIETSLESIAGLIDSSIKMIREGASAKHIEVISAIDKETLDTMIKVDKRRFVQIMTNLLSNAVKYTPKAGKITISAGKYTGKMLFSVADTGIGINPGEQGIIFEAFYQVYSKTRGKSQGVGLGLSVARHLVEMHGGEIWVDSEGDGKGSRFSFTIPLDGDTKQDGTQSL